MQNTDKSRLNTEFEFSAGGIVIDNDKVLLIKSSPDKSEAAFWTFPKGKIETGESEETAALREVKEETGTICSTVERIGASHYLFIRRDKIVIKTVAWFGMRVKKTDLAVLDRPVKIGWKEINKAFKVLKYPADVSMLKRYLSLKGN